MGVPTCSCSMLLPRTFRLLHVVLHPYHTCNRRTFKGFDEFPSWEESCVVRPKDKENPCLFFFFANQCLLLKRYDKTTLAIFTHQFALVSIPFCVVVTRFYITRGSEWEPWCIRTLLMSVAIENVQYDYEKNVHGECIGLMVCGERFRMWSNVEHCIKV